MGSEEQTQVLKLVWQVLLPRQTKSLGKTVHSDLEANDNDLLMEKNYQKCEKQRRQISVNSKLIRAENLG